MNSNFKKNIFTVDPNSTICENPTHLSSPTSNDTAVVTLDMEGETCSKEISPNYDNDVLDDVDDCDESFNGLIAVTDISVNSRNNNHDNINNSSELHIKNSTTSIEDSTSDQDINDVEQNFDEKLSITEFLKKPPSTNEQILPVPSVASIICRICHTSEQTDRLISPCLCKGTLAYVHRYCLERWLSQSGIMQCELCMYRFKTEFILRYKYYEALRIWYRHPNHRGLLQSDFMVCFLLTVITFGLVTVSAFGLQYFLAQSKQLGYSKVWIQGSVLLFLIIVLMSYLLNAFFIVKAHINPWYRWWQSNRQIRLILSNEDLMRSQDPIQAQEH